MQEQQCDSVLQRFLSGKLNGMMYGLYYLTVCRNNEYVVLSGGDSKIFSMRNEDCTINPENISWEKFKFHSKFRNKTIEILSERLSFDLNYYVDEDSIKNVKFEGFIVALIEDCSKGPNEDNLPEFYIDIFFQYDTISAYLDEIEWKDIHPSDGNLTKAAR